MRKIFSLIAAVLFAGSMMATEVTFTKVDFAGQGTANTGSEVSATKDGVTFTFSKGYCADESLRCYAHGALSITAEATIEKINFTTTGGKTGGLDAEVTVGATSYSVADLASQARFTEIKVTLGGEVPPVEPTEEYYLTGTIRGWAETADDNYKFVVNTAAETEGEYMLQGITLAANDELKAIGILGENVTWYPTATNLTVAADGTYDIYFRPDGQGGEGWHEGTLYLAEVVPATAISCLDVYQMAKGDVVGLLNDVTVTFANGKNVWVVDGSASMLIYFSANTNYAPGDVLSGIAGTVDIYNGVTEVKPSADQAAAIVATPGEAPAAIQTVVVETTDVNKYIVMPEIEFEADAAFAEGTASNITMNGVVVRNNFKNGFAFEAGKSYDIYGVVTIYQGNPQVYFITAVEATASAIDNTNVDAQVVKFFENGQLIIIKNGVRYNAQGAVVR